MASDKKKYEILPGVEIPDMKAINEAVSDFSASAVGDYDIRAHKPVFTDAGVPADTATAEELAALQALGDDVAAEELKAKAESKARMQAILNSAVQSPESLTNLKKENASKMSDEDREKMEAEMAAEQAKKDEEAAKQKAREERRELQQRLLLEARERAKAEAEAKQNETKEAIAEETKDLPDEAKSVDIASDEETYSGFSEFLDDDKNE
ncbi:MAG: hypothetical protein K5745_06195 [Saccharofermentans sp.]|nr:hypothetical protein [Saccharofermentans sp.]